MRKFLKPLLIVGFFFLPTMTVIGQTIPGATDKGRITIPIHPKNPKPKPDKPKAPSNQYIIMTYDGVSSKCMFDLSHVQLEYLSVEIENQTTGELHYGNVDATYPVMDVYLTPSSYTITCTSDDGSIYAGDFEVF